MSATLDIAIIVQPVAVAAGDLSISLALSTGTLTFDQLLATDIGDYVGPFVHQRCLVQRQGPWTVFFRPDADGARQEVTVEYGTQYNFAVHPPVSADGTVPAQLLAPYVATISQNGAVLATINVPTHWWSARWRWQSAPRPIMRRVTDLVAMKALPPMDVNAVWSTSPLPALAWGGPMSSAGLTTGMGTTGDREELGFVTEAQAGYLMTGDAGSLMRLLSQAEAAGSVGYWIRDAATNAIVDIKAHPYVCFIEGVTAAYTIPVAPSPSRTTYPNYFIKDASHLPPLSFVAFLLTDDPWFLEGAQADAVYSVLFTNFTSHTLKLPGMVDVSQERAVAWGIRDQLRMAAFAPTSPPSWLLPASHFQACAGDTLSWLKNQMTSADPVTANFHFVGGSKTDDWGFEVSAYQAIVVGWAKWSRLFPTWDDAITWLAYSVVAMTEADSPPGWDRRYPVPYDIHFPVPVPTNWTDLWTAYVASAAFNPAPSAWTAGVLAPQVLTNNIQLGYANWTRAALSLLAQSGVTGAQAARDWLTPQLAVDIPGSPKGVFPSGYKWAF